MVDKTTKAATHAGMESPATDRSALPVLDEGAAQIGSLLPIGEWVLAQPELIRSIADWRQKNRKMFFTQFMSTPERTTAYLADSIIGSPNRLLHLICDEGNRPVGHIGLANIDGDRAELDNLMRGQSGGHPRLVHFAELAFLDWAFQAYPLRRIDARFFSYNWMVRDLHEEIGFRDPIRSALRRHEEAGVVSHEECSAESANVDYGFIRMHLMRDDFYRQHHHLVHGQNASILAKG